MQPVDRAQRAVHPQQGLVTGVPHGPLGQLGPGIERELGLETGHRHLTALSTSLH